MSEYTISKIEFFSRVWCDGANDWTRTPEDRGRVKFTRVNPETGTKSMFTVPENWVEEFDRYVRDLDPDEHRRFLRVCRERDSATGKYAVDEISETIRNTPLKQMRRSDFVRTLGYDPKGDGWTRLPDQNGRAVYQTRRKPERGKTRLDVACECREGTRSKLDDEGYRIYTITVPTSYVDYYNGEFAGLPKAEFMERVRHFF